MSDRGSLVIGKVGLLKEFRHVVADDVGEVLSVNEPFGADLSDDEVQLILAVHA
jgi:hypothetical protein